MNRDPSGGFQFGNLANTPDRRGADDNRTRNDKEPKGPQGPVPEPTAIEKFAFAVVSGICLVIVLARMGYWSL